MLTDEHYCEIRKNESEQVYTLVKRNENWFDKLFCAKRRKLLKNLAISQIAQGKQCASNQIESLGNAIAFLAGTGVRALIFGKFDYQ